MAAVTDVLSRSKRLWLFVPLVTIVAFALGYLQKGPCHRAGWPPVGHLTFGQFCYSDIPVLFVGRGLIMGIFPYSPRALQHPLEYPVGTGAVMDLTARLSRWLEPTIGPESLQMYFIVNVLVLLGFALITVAAVAALLHRLGGRPADSLLVAGAPSMILAGTINWDLVVVAATVLALLAWAYDRPWLAGAMIGVGTATKLYPIFILGPMLVLCLRQQRMPAFWRAAAAAVIAWTAANLPVALKYPDGWLEFFRFNADRPADYGALWYALKLVGFPVPGLNVVAPLSFVLLCGAIGALAWWAPRAPSIEQLSFLVVAAFLVTNKVYSPQYVLWLLPLAVLARLHVPFGRALRDFAIWQAAEAMYWAAVWMYLDGSSGGWYPLAIGVRIVVMCWYAGQIVRDVQARAPEPQPALPVLVDSHAGG
jgi:uncharacterized membrane protein